MNYVKSDYLNMTMKDNGECIIYHSFYGNIAKVGPKVVDLLNYFSTPKTITDFCNDRNESESDIEKVIDSCLRKKYLIECDNLNDELSQIRSDVSLQAYPERLLRFYVTTKCNMACSYCFESSHSNDNFMSLDIIADGLKAFNSWLLNSNEGKIDFNLLKVNFFGGEPLICFDLLKVAVPYIREILRFSGVTTKITINTNGTLLDSERIDWLIANNIHSYISVDGLKKHHDKYRVFKNGQGTFDIVIDNLKQLISKASDEYIRKYLTVLVTINPGNVFEVHELINYLSSMGVKNISLNAAFNCAVSNDITNWTLLNEQEIDTFIKESIAIRDSMYKKDVHIGGMWGYIPNRLRTGGFAFCQAVGYEIGVCPSRKLYACPCTFNNENHSIGLLNDASFQFNSTFERWSERKVTNTDTCKGCSISGICRGGCPGVSILNNKDIYLPQQCDFWKKFVNSFVSNAL